MTGNNEGYRCHWCGNQYASREFYPACSQDHLDKLRNEPNEKMTNLIYSLAPDTAPKEIGKKIIQLKLWAKFVNHQYAAWAALFELITDFKPPKLKEVSTMISGHRETK